uniref:G protein-coupled receptor 108 n=1 Tax=Latimeria chalumnae TaxID=7897 RepID=H3B815_LATCH
MGEAMMAASLKKWPGEGGLCLCLLLLAALRGSIARIHRLSLQGERRSEIHLNSFGFYTNGTLDVSLKNLTLSLDNVNFEKFPIGFSLLKSKIDGILSYSGNESDSCVLKRRSSSEPLTLFVMDIKHNRVVVKKYGEQKNLEVLERPKTMTKTEEEDKDRPAKADTLSSLKATTVLPSSDSSLKTVAPSKPGRFRRDGRKYTIKEQGGTNLQSNQKEKIPPQEKTEELKQNELVLGLAKINKSYTFYFHVKIGSKSEEGLYNLNFHNCYNLQPGKENAINILVEITEKNPGGYLSAAEMPLPLLYIIMSGFFFTAAMFWVYILLKHRYNVFKIHWLMATLAFMKSLSLLFHSINYYFINKEGHPIEGWAVMYYITHLLKGALLFITIALIGTGWAFIKYILSDKEKKIFVIVFPLQVLANIAFIIIESTEKGTSEYALWKEILFLVDLICCGAILFPVVWSIRHLQEASSTDGKAAMNLVKLKLFRHYYVMIVCYIYFTRIIAILLKVTVPFQWQWFYELLVEVSTLVFFVLTGYKFQPASNNPYLQLPQDEDNVEMDEV